MHIEKFRATQTYRMCNHFERQEGDGITRGNENIHAERTHLNYNLCACREESGYQQIQNILARDDVFVYGQGKRKDLVNMCDVVITVPKSLPHKLYQDFFAMSARFLENRFGVSNGMNVVSSWVHMDETTPHMHFAFVPLVNANEKRRAEGYTYKLCANDVVTRKNLKTLHQDMQKFLESKLLCKVDIVTNETVKSVDMVTFKRRKLAQAAAELAEKQEKVSRHLETLENGSGRGSRLKREPVKNFFIESDEKCQVGIRELDRLENRYNQLLQERDALRTLDQINRDLNGTTARQLRSVKEENKLLRQESLNLKKLEAELQAVKQSFRIAVEALDRVNPALAKAVRVATENGLDSDATLNNVNELYNAFRNGNQRTKFVR